MDVQRYRDRLSGPLLDRIDIHVEVPAVQYRDISSNVPGESSDVIRARVQAAREVQRERFVSSAFELRIDTLHQRKKNRHFPMKKLTLSTFIAASIAATVFAGDTKLEGTATCAKCDLGTADKCRAAIVVKGADGKPVVYLANENDQGTKLAEEVCGGGKPATVVGTVMEKDHARSITITSYSIK